jgi:hypothetical protein
MAKTVLKLMPTPKAEFRAKNRLHSIIKRNNFLLRFIKSESIIEQDYG